MRTKISPSALLATVLTGMLASCAADVALDQSDGTPVQGSAQALKGSSSADAYLEPVAPGIHVNALLTVGDSVNLKPDGINPYALVGRSDGLGAFDNGDGTFTLLVDHELDPFSGVVRAHGARGAFVSKWTIKTGNLRVLHGEDLIQTVMLWNGSSHVPSTAPVVFIRFCSANLPPRSALYDAATGLGFDGRLFLNGEEASILGRAFAHGLDGTSYQLPHLGRLSFENVLANPASGHKTVVISTDDSANGQVYVYVGEKRNLGSPVEMAGLIGGHLYGVRIAGLGAETDSTVVAPGTRFSLYALGDVAGSSGTQLQTASRGPIADPAQYFVTEFNRPEDGNWDPRAPSDFYFTATATFAGNSRLWRLRFDDVRNPEAGGTVDVLLDGSEGQHQLDNMTIDTFGHVLLQEDPGAVDHLARIWRYDIASDQLDEVVRHRAELFDPASTAGTFITNSEESSGIIDVGDILGQGHYLFTSMVHTPLGGELNEMGQLLMLHLPPGQPGGPN
ncbi:MAG TPA: alkaline phosphatase PhoX [Polyangiales bacterium]|nr:alkaline phosphatase PhoX [Polyangiales bacterium]